jgi:hypothetical protein
MRTTLTALLLLIPIAAWGEELPSSEEPDPTAYRHRGFHFHLESGGGYFYSGNETGSASGLNIPVALSLGGAIVENLILSAELWGGVVLGPNGPIESPSIATAALGVNLTYYFMPANVYLSATPSIVAVASTGTGCVAPRFDSGSLFVCSVGHHPGDPYQVSIAKFGMRTAIGKEWWISKHWAIGLALQFSFTLAGEVNFGTLESTKASALFGGVILGLTYN